MAQSDDILAAVTTVQTTVSTLVADQTTVLADVVTLLAELTAISPDPKLTSAIDMANGVVAALNAADDKLKAAIATIPATPPPAPITGTSVTTSG